MSAALTGTAWLHSAHLVNNANYANQEANDDDEWFKSYGIGSLMCVCVCLWGRWEGGRGVWHLMVSICVCRTDKR